MQSIEAEVETNGCDFSKGPYMSEFNRKEYHTVILAGLLHDVGKFLQRVVHDAPLSGKHEKLGAQFVSGQGPFDKDGIKKELHGFSEKISDEWVNKVELGQAIAAHHRGSGVCGWIVHKADSYSTKERFEPDQGVKTYPPRGSMIALKSVFSHIRLGQENEPGTHSYNAHILDSFKSMPVKNKEKFQTGEADSLFSDFVHELGTIDTTGISFDRFFNTLSSILEKYTWCLPCHTHPAIADVSIYDHLKSTSAIAACLYKFHHTYSKWRPREIDEDDIDKFLLVGGDLSGIQNYLYQISSITGEGGVAKRLRARSFFISALVEVTVLKLLHALELPVVCNLVSTGGHFVILAPNTDETCGILKKCKKEICQWLLDTFSGELALILDWETTLKGNDFFRKPGESHVDPWDEIDGRRQEKNPEQERQCNYRDKIDALQERIAIGKQQRFKTILAPQDVWNEAEFMRTAQYDAYAHGKSDCLSCHKFPALFPDPHDAAATDIVFCNKCYIDKLIGRLLLDAQYLAIGRKNAGHVPETEQCFRSPNSDRFYFYNDGWFIKPLAEFDPAKWDVEYYVTVQRLRDHYHETAPLPMGVTHRFLANYTPFFRTVEEAGPICQKCKESMDCDVRKRLQKPSAEPELCTFGCIAASGCEPTEEPDTYRGSQLLGVLKADVDNLGLIFSQGLGNRVTVSRYLTLSRMIDLFFSGWIYRILNEEPIFRKIYTVYSGGDDLVLVGPWEIILIFAGRLNRDFRKFTCNNPDITLSAGIAVVKPKHPISDAVERADQCLERSKLLGKNRLTVFGTTISWEYFPKLADVVRIFDSAMRHKVFGDILTIGFLQRLLIYQKMYMRSQEGKIHNIIFHARMHNDVERNLAERIASVKRKTDQNKQLRKEIKWFESSVIGFLKNAPMNRGLMQNFRIPIFWTLYRNRNFSVRRQNNERQPLIQAKE